MKIKYCHNCGNPINESDVFCSKCGTALKKTELPLISPPLKLENGANEISDSIRAIRVLLNLVCKLFCVLNLKGWVCWFVICLIEVLTLSQMDLFNFLDSYNDNVIIITGLTTLLGGYIYNLVKWISKES